MPISVKGLLSLDGGHWFSTIIKAEQVTARFVDKLGPMKTKLAAAFSVAAVTAFTRSVIQFGSELQDTATRLGISTDAVQELKFSAKQTGAEINDVTGGVERMSKALEEVKSGSKRGLELQDTFKRMGASLEDLKNKSPEELFKQIGSTLEKTNVTSQVTADIMDIFGKSGGKLIPVLKELRENAAKARGSFGFISPQEVKTLDEAGDKIDAITTGLKVMGAKVIVGTTIFDDLLEGMFREVAGDVGGGTFNQIHSRQRAQIAVMERELERRKKEQEALDPKPKEKTSQELAKDKEVSEKERKKALKEVAKTEKEAADIAEKARLKALSDEERLIELLKKRAAAELHLKSVAGVDRSDVRAQQVDANVKKTLAETNSEIADLQGRTGAKRASSHIQSDSLTRVGNFLGTSGANNIVSIAQQQTKHLSSIDKTLQAIFKQRPQSFGFNLDANT